MPDRLTASDVGCWVIKSRRAPEEIDATWGAGGTRMITRCLRRSYRLQLMAVGQPCLLWVSGARAGVQAIGRLTSAPELSDNVDPTRSEPSAEVTLHRLAEPLARSALLADHVLSGAEVIRMPAGSNPSYLSPERLSALLEMLAPDDLRAARWIDYPPGV